MAEQSTPLNWTNSSPADNIAAGELFLLFYIRVIKMAIAGGLCNHLLNVFSRIAPDLLDILLKGAFRRLKVGRPLFPRLGGEHFLNLLSIEF